MTLILSVISPTWAMQASDRRVTRINADREILAAVDDENKAIFVAERLTFAYTGHANIGGGTAEWFQGQVAQSLAEGRSVDDALEMVSRLTEQYFRSLPPYVDDRTHAFVGVGWTEGDVRERAPFVACLSNSIDSRGEWLPTPRDTFGRYDEALGTHDEFALFVAGAPLEDRAVRILRAQIGSQIAGSDRPEPVARILIQTIRDAADENSAIGKGVMVNCLPVAPGPPTGDVMLIGGLPERDVRTFTYVGHEGFEGRYLGPLIVSSDGSQLGNLIAEGSEVTAERGGFGVTYRPASAPVRRSGAIGQRVREFRLGRNEPCWCGSGKKFKRCHGP